MQAVLRTPLHGRGAFFPAAILSTQSRRLAHQSYGNKQSGHPEGTHENNPKSHHEHPGPESPASKGSNSSSSPTSTSSSSSSKPSEASNGAEPKIYNPSPAAHKDDPEVKKHNEQMAQRADRTVNQQSEDGSKVDGEFWQGDAGNTVKS